MTHMTRSSRYAEVNDLIHHALKGCWGSLQTKRHKPELIQAKEGHECCFSSILFCHWYLPIPPNEIQCGDELGSPLVINYVIIHSLHWVVI